MQIELIFHEDGSLLSEDKILLSSLEVKKVMIRAEHNCHLCKKEWLGRCFGSKHYGMDVSMEGNRNENKRIIGEWADGDLPICEEYEYGGTPEHLEEIEYAEAIGVTELSEKQVELLHRNDNVLES